ncbi:MAG TPA: lysophospholipid acyltransferase family protein [Smithella sp.]|nr:lysophospholipid acyltransferase family protein [Smithella sp.]
MELGNAPKEIFEKYRQLYLDNQQRFSTNLRSFVEKSEDRVARASYQPYKWLFILPLLLATTFVFGICAMITSLLLTPRAGGIFAVMWARVNSFFTPMAVNVNGAKNIKPGTSYVIISNHQSMYDIYVLYGWLGVDFKWVMKKELERVPVLGLACRILGHIYIDRSNPQGAVETIRAAKTKIVNGTSVLFFPEGTRSDDGALRPFKKGAFKMALDLGIPILPVTINGTRNVLPKKTLDLMPGGATMTIHQPISVADYREENINELMERARLVINSSLD